MSSHWNHKNFADELVSFNFISCNVKSIELTYYLLNIDFFAYIFNANKLLMMSSNAIWSHCKMATLLQSWHNKEKAYVKNIYEDYSNKNCDNIPSIGLIDSLNWNTINFNFNKSLTYEMTYSWFDHIKLKAALSFHHFNFPQ